MRVKPDVKRISTQHECNLETDKIEKYKARYCTTTMVLLPVFEVFHKQTDDVRYLFHNTETAELALKQHGHCLSKTPGSISVLVRLIHESGP